MNRKTRDRREQHQQGLLDLESQEQSQAHETNRRRGNIPHGLLREHDGRATNGAGRCGGGALTNAWIWALCRCRLNHRPGITTPA